MRAAQVNKLTTLGLVLLFIFAGLAISLTRQNVADGSAYMVNAGLGMSNKVLHAERYASGRLDCENCDVSTPFTKVSVAPRPLDPAPAVRAGALAGLHGHVRKIPLHMLASVLLI
jgi:hypothetical protein